MYKPNPARRKFFRNSVFGSLSLGLLPRKRSDTYPEAYVPNTTFNPNTYLSLDLDKVRSVVSASHSQMDVVKDLVDNQPELACACWDWGFGDFETALGAAAHMGRRDIAEYLMRNGARPDIYTFAMLGDLDTVKSMIASCPGIQSKPGPHGISLLQHAKNRLRHKDLPQEQKDDLDNLIDYLEGLGDADWQPEGLPMDQSEKEKYLGTFQFGDSDDEVFEMVTNMRGILSIRVKGTFGKPLVKVSENVFSPFAAPSIKISFEVEEDVVKSLTIHEPMPLIKAIKV